MYRVTFDSRGGDDVDSIDVIEGSTIERPDNPTKEGYSFDGWYADDGLSDAWDFENDTVSEATTLYAKWGTDSYDITYELNSGTNHADNPATYTIEAETITLQDPTRAGYTFGGWYSDSGFTDKVISIPQGSTGNKTLYAKWSASTNTAYRVEHYQQDVSGSGYTKVTGDTENLTGTTGETATAMAKTYDGFSENTSHTDRVASGTIAADGSLVLKLYYDRETFTVSYEENGGSIVTDTTGVRYGAKISEPTSPTKEGYIFDGWYADEGLNDAWDFENDTVTEATTFYAKWREPTVGGLGPSGGYIFYDDAIDYDWDGDETIELHEKDLLDGTNDGTVSGDRYLEAAPAGWSGGGEDPSKIWGGEGDAYTYTAIGTGESNTQKMVTEFGDDDYAAKLCADYSVTVDGTTYNDWFLPSKDELDLMYENLYLNSLGGFSKVSYWSSSESDDFHAWYQYFKYGDQYDGASRNANFMVRPIRAF